MRKIGRWHLHICSPWSGPCAMPGIRLNIRTPWRFIIIALNPAVRVSDREGKWHYVSVRRHRG